MPLYEYICDACGQRFERIQKFSDPLADVCDKCGKGPVHKQISAPGIQFKGSGWYITDYARKGGAPGESSSKADKKSDGDGAAAGSTTGDSSSKDSASKDSSTKDAPSKDAGTKSEPTAAAPAAKPASEN